MSHNRFAKSRENIIVVDSIRAKSATKIQIDKLACNETVEQVSCLMLISWLILESHCSTCK